LKHPVDRETQKNKVQIFSNSISEGLNKTARRFVEDALVGISLGGSLRLTEISRALMEDIPLHATHKRLSRNLANPAISDVLSANLLQAGALQIQQDPPMMLYGMSCTSSAHMGPLALNSKRHFSAHCCSSLSC